VISTQRDGLSACINTHYMTKPQQVTDYDNWSERLATCCYLWLASISS